MQNSDIKYTNDMNQEEMKEVLNVFENYIESGENVLWFGRIYRRVLWVLYSSSFLLVIVIAVFAKFYLLFLGIPVLVFLLLSMLVQKYAVTNKRVIIRSGVIGADFQSYPFTQIQSKNVSVGLVGLIFKCGTVMIDTGETEYVRSSGGHGGGSRTKFHKFVWVREPYEVLKMLGGRVIERQEALYSGRADEESRKGRK